MCPPKNIYKNYGKIKINITVILIKISRGIKLKKNSLSFLILNLLFH